MSVIVDKISSFTFFGEEISQPLLNSVPQSFIKAATNAINRALGSKSIQEILKNKEVTTLNYEIIADQIIVQTETVQIRAKVESESFHRIYDYLARINKVVNKPLLNEITQRQANPSEGEEADSNLSSGSNILAMIRNALSINPSIGPNHTLVTSLGSLSGIFSVILGLRLMSYATEMRTKAEEIEDTDGIHRSTLLSLNAGALTGLGTSFFIEKVYQTFVDSQGGTFFGKLIVPLYIAVSALSVMFGVYRLHKTYSFKAEFDLYYQNKSLKEDDQLKASLAFLKDSIEPTALERRRIEELAEISCSNRQDRQARVAKKIDQLVQRKTALLERRVNGEFTKKLKDFNFKKLQEGDPLTLCAAKKICQEMIDTHSKKRLYFSVKLIASFIGLAAAISFAATPIIAIPATLVIISCLIHLATNHQKTFDLIVQHILGAHYSIQNVLFAENGAAAI